jgi:hypothetical protein
MRKPDALNLVFSTSAIICFYAFALNAEDNQYSMKQGTVQQPLAYTTQADFSQQLQGGIVLRFEFGLIIVKPTAPPESPQPTALTIDAIITSSVKSKIAGQSQLPSRNFEIQTDDGVVTIHSKGESLDQAAKVINLALEVPEVRRIVYTMPSNV